MKYHDEPTPKNKKGENQGEKPKSDQAITDPSEDDFIYGIDRLNLGKPVYDSKIDSKWLLTQRREFQMANKENRNNYTKREYNELSSFLIRMKRAESKTSHYSPTLQICINNRSGRSKLKTSKSYWTA